MFRVRVDFDTLAVQARFRGRFSQAQEALDQQVIKDCDQFVPYAEGDLRKAGRVSEPGHVVWDMPYARYQYYLAEGAHYTTPGTGAKWFERGKGIYRDGWLALVQKVVTQ